MTRNIDSHYLKADLYDQFYGSYKTAPDWFLSELSLRNQILELACGTGRVAIPLAQKGLTVTGIDYSQPMLDLAEKKANEQGVEVDWISGDMRSFDLERSFDAILLLSNSLWHLHEIVDFEDCLKCVRNHLQPTGIFVLDVFVPSINFLKRDPKKRYPFGEYIDAETGTSVAVTEAYRYETDTQIAHAVHYKGNSDEEVGRLNLKMYFPKELDVLLQYNGMKIQAKYGSWGKEPFGPKSNHQLYICSLS